MCGNFRPAQQLNGRKIIKLTAAPVATTVKPPSGPTQPSASSTVKPVSTGTSAAMKGKEAYEVCWTFLLASFCLKRQVDRA